MASKKRQQDWQGHGDYMHAKIRKLDQQFAVKPGERNTEIFKGVSIFVNGYTSPPSDILRNLICSHGGKYQQYYSRSLVTHIIATNLPDSKITEIRDKKIVRPQWILDCMEKKELLPIESYLLYDGKQARQKTLRFTKMFENSNHTSKSHIENDGHKQGMSPSEVSQAKSNKEFDQSELQAENNKVEQSLSISVKSQTEKELGSKTDLTFEDNAEQMLPRKQVTQFQNTDLCENNSEKHDSSSSKNSKESPVGEKTANQKPVKAGDTNFVSEFYNNSRLHYLSTWGAELKQFTSELIKKRVSEGVVPRKYPAPGYHGRVIMHVDMDCFFVSVGLRGRPDLVGKPLAVCHAGKRNTGKDTMPIETSSNFTSMSEIASCSYEARKTGVKNGMFLGTARKLCPDIICIPYHFQEYRTVSRQLYQILVNHTHDIEAVSCDEAYIDMSRIIDEKTSPIDLAKQIRHEIKQQTQCTASIGIGNNILMARLCTRKAKPDGQFYLHGQDMIKEFIAEQNVSDLPGVGYSIKEKLQAIGVTSCGDVQRVSLQSLQDVLGEKTGLMVYRFSHGEDDRPLRTERERKSVSAEINYGIRFIEDAEPEKFINELAHEVTKRLKDIDAKGQSVTLKLKVRKKGAPEPRKYMGHGICDNVARSTTLPFLTDDTKTIATKCLQLLRQLKIIPSDIRGMGIQVNKLTQHKPKNTRTLLDFATKGTQRQTPTNVAKSKKAHSETLTDETEKRNITLDKQSINVKQITQIAQIEQTKSISQDEQDRIIAPNSKRKSIASVIQTENNTIDLQANITGETKAKDIAQDLDAKNRVTIQSAHGVTTTRIENDAFTCSSPSSSPSNSFLCVEYIASPNTVRTTALTVEEALERNTNLPPLPKFFPSPSGLPKQRSSSNKRSLRLEEEGLSASPQEHERLPQLFAAEVLPSSQGSPFEELELPSPSQLDHSALQALPPEIRLNIQRQYAKRNNNAVVIETENAQPQRDKRNEEQTSQVHQEEEQREEGVSLNGARTCSDVKTVIKAWTNSSELFQEDVDIVAEYFLQLIEHKYMEQLWVLIKYLIRCAVKTRSKAWCSACKDVIRRIQASVIDKHGAPLALTNTL